MAKIDEVLSKKEAIAEAQKEIDRRNKISKSSKGKKKKKKKLTKKEAQDIIKKHLKRRKARKAKKDKKKVVNTTQKKQKPIVLTDKEAKSLLQVNIQAKERRRKKPKTFAEKRAEQFQKTGIADLSQLRGQRRIASEVLGYTTQSSDPLSIRKAGRGRYNVGVPGVRGISREEGTGEFVEGGYTGLVAGSKVGQQVAGRRQLGRGQLWYERPPEDDDIQIRGDSGGRQPPNQRKPRFSDSDEISVDIPPKPPPSLKTTTTQTETQTQRTPQPQPEPQSNIVLRQTDLEDEIDTRPSNVIGELESDSSSVSSRAIIIQPPRSRLQSPALTEESDLTDFETTIISRAPSARQSISSAESRYSDSSSSFKTTTDDDSGGSGGGGLGAFRNREGQNIRLIETIEPTQEEDIIGKDDDVGGELQRLGQATRLEDEVRFREREDETRPENIPSTLPEGLRRPTGELLTRQLPQKPLALKPTPENVRLTQPLTQRIADTIRNFISPEVPPQLEERRPISVREGRGRGRPRRDISTPNIEDKINELEGQQKDLTKRIDAIKIKSGKPFKMGKLNPSGDSPEQITEASTYIQEWIYNTNLDRFEKGQEPLSEQDEKDLEQSGEDLLKLRIELRRLRGLRSQRKKKKKKK